MGLDNGFLVKSNRRKLTRADLPEGLVYPFDIDYEEGIEIIYHRKDWGWRDSIMLEFGWKDVSLYDDTKLYTIDTPAQVLKLIEITASWLDEEHWENDGRSIWEYKESARRHLIQDISNLAIFYGWMLQNPDVYLEFYDSY